MISAERAQVKKSPKSNNFQMIKKSAWAFFFGFHLLLKTRAEILKKIRWFLRRLEDTKRTF